MGNLRQKYTDEEWKKLEESTKDYPAGRYHTLNYEAEGRNRFFTKEGKTTVQNLRLAWGESLVEDLLHFINILLPSEVLKYWLSPTELENYLLQASIQKHKEILEWIKEKHIWQETGDDIQKDTEFIQDFFQVKYTVATFKSKLRACKFSHSQLDAFLKCTESHEISIK